MTTFTYTNPTVGGSEDTWGTTLNANWTALGGFLGTLDSAELAVLDGITATTAELNHVVGVTSEIQPQIDALRNLSFGATAPTSPAAGMLWYESDSQWIWLRNEANDAWIRFAYFNQTTGRMAIQDGTETVGTGGVATGLIGDQTNATWQAGTSTLDSLVSPAQIKLAVESLAPDDSIGVGQLWSSKTSERIADTIYQNTTGKAIMLSVQGIGNDSAIYSASGTPPNLRIAYNNAPLTGAYEQNHMSVIIPDNHYYKITGGFNEVRELS